MAVKATFGARSKQTLLGGAARARPLMMQVVENGIAFLLGALCASAELFGRCSPFGVALTAAAGAGLRGFSSLVGSVLGYLFFHGLSGGLHYAAASVLTYAIAFAIYDTPWREKRFLMPGIAATLCGICRFIHLAGLGFGGAEVIFFLTELPLLFGAAYVYRAPLSRQAEDGFALANLHMEERVGALALVATLLAALCGVTILGDFSLGRPIAAILVMLVAKRGAQTGLLAGTLAGLTLDLASGRGPYYCMAYAVAGVAYGFAGKRGRLAGVLAYVLANGVVVLWTWESGMRIPLLYEVFVASVLFFILPRRLGEQTERLLALRAPGSRDWVGSREVVIRRVRESAHAFRAVYESVRESLSPEKSYSEDPEMVFRAAAERQCRSCKLRELCWQKEYQSTQQLLGDALRQMTARGKAESGDFASYFRSRCIHFTDFLATVNEELTAYQYRQQYRGRLRESRAALCRQYAEVDNILEKAAQEIAVELTPDLPREARLRHYLREKGLSEDGRVYYDELGHLRIEMPGTAHLRTEEGREGLATLLGVALRPPEELEEGRIVFAQAEPFVATAGVFGASKKGETVSGDTGTWFRRPDGLLCILLCDGMGSGPAARQESSLAVRLLENFLRAGVEPEAALGTVNAALALRGEEGGGCSTVDLLTVELYTGLCSVYKFGAAPTYLNKGGTISCIKGSAMPAGLLTGDEAKPDITQFRAASGDWILLVSDGVVTGEDDAWLRAGLLGYQGDSPGELAEELLVKSHVEHAGADDATVIAVRLDKRELNKRGA